MAKSLNEYANRVAQIIGQPDNHSMKERIKDMIKDYFAKYIIQSIDRNGITPYYKIPLLLNTVAVEETAMINEFYNIWGHMENGVWVRSIDDAEGHNITKTIKTISNGRLYNWYAAINLRRIAPIGWHVPTKEEWQTLIDFCGGNDIAGEKLKSIEYNGTDDYGFKATCSGSETGGSWSGLGNIGIYATSSEYIYDNREFTTFLVSKSNSNINSDRLYLNRAPSIRLIKDNSINEGDIIIDGDTYHSITIGTQVWLQQNLAVTHYQNGDLIGSDFNGTEGAVTAYTNDENNVYINKEVIIGHSVINPNYKIYIDYETTTLVPKPMNIKNDSPFTKVSIPFSAKLFSYVSDVSYRIASTLIPTRACRLYSYSNNKIKVKRTIPHNNLVSNETITQIEVEGLWENPEEVIGFYDYTDNQDLPLPFPNEMMSFIIAELLKIEFGLIPKDTDITKE